MHVCATRRRSSHSSWGSYLLPHLPPPTLSLSPHSTPPSCLAPWHALSPDTFEQWPYDMGTMLGWAFEPAPEDMLLKLVEKGKRDARSWALVNVPVEQLQLAGGGR